MWGIIPAAGAGSRIQPLAFSKELLPVGSRFDGKFERPRAVSEYLVERMLMGGADKICFVIAPGKSDILEYYGVGSLDSVAISFVVQPRPLGLCDAIFRSAPLIAEEESILVGLPDTIWCPADALASLGDDTLEFLLFPVTRPEFFDAVLLNEENDVLEIEVKVSQPRSSWIWGAFKAPGRVLHQLHQLWLKRERRDEYIGTLVNAWIAAGGRAKGRRSGEAYVDVGTLHGYREAIHLLEKETQQPPLEFPLETLET